MTGPRVANISAGAPFVDSLAAGIWQMVGRDDPLALTRVTVLLPTRRAIRSLRETFLRLGGGAALLLPRLMPLGELDEEALLLEESAAAGAIDLPPAIPGLRPNGTNCRRAYSQAGSRAVNCWAQTGRKPRTAPGGLIRGRLSHLGRPPSPEEACDVCDGSVTSLL